VGEIVIGILLGPSLLGILAPDLFGYVFRSAPPEPMTILSQVGLLLLMFQIGLEFDFAHLAAAANRRAVLLVSVVGLVLPFLLGLGFGYGSTGLLPSSMNGTAYSLFIGTAFSITALPILGRIMIELNIQRTHLGVIAISSAAINDVAGWLMLAVVTALTTANFTAGGFVETLIWLAVYVSLCWFVVRPILKRWITRLQTESAPLAPNLIGLLLGAIFVSGMVTYKLGIFAIFGGFMLGVLLHDESRLVAAWREKVGSFVEVFFLPIFFTYTGLRTNIGALDSGSLWLWCLLLVGLATTGKFLGCYVAARMAGLDSAQSRVVAIMMNTRALMELVVINVGYDLGVIPSTVFTMLVIMALVSTLVTTPLLRRWLPAARLEEAE
jgi:Kef-type K+ transport system membrane component KefB